MIWVILGLLAVLFLYGGTKVADVAQVARNAGFEGTDLVTAVAIAYAESGGDPSSEGDYMLGGHLVPKGTSGAIATSFGLWQIHWTVHPETYVNSPSELFDPQANANAAFSIYTAAGNSFSPWSTFKSGAYNAHLDKASSEVNA